MAPAEQTAARKRSPRARPVVDYDDSKHLISPVKTRAPDPVKRSRSKKSSRSTSPSGSGSEAEQVSADELEDAWETQSYFEDVFEALAEDKFFTDDPTSCTEAESLHLRKMLKSLGPEELWKQTIHAGVITAKKMLTAFGMRPPPFMEGSDDTAYWTLLALAMKRERGRRLKLDKYNTIDDAVDLLRKSKNIIVLTGAGISTSLGIPDFRSKGTGLYSKLAHLGLSDPQEVFDINVFKDDPSVFYTIAKDILPSGDRFSPTHQFIKLLQDKGKLLTNYSQNIDNLEARAGVQSDKLVQCHGSFATASCVKCGHRVPGEAIFPEIRAQKIPKCRKCALKKKNQPAPSSRKRKMGKDGTEKKGGRRRPGEYDSNSDSEFDFPEACGVMKPDITFFGEKLPDLFHDRLAENDRDKVDLCVVIGTSLKVAPVSEVPAFLPPGVPQIYISRTPVSHVQFDIDLLGDCDIVVAELCHRLGWQLNHEMVPKNQVVEVTSEEGFESRHVFKQVQPVVVEEKHEDEVICAGQGEPLVFEQEGKQNAPKTKGPAATKGGATVTARIQKELDEAVCG